MTMLVDFTGKVLQTKIRHTTSTHSDVSVTRRFTYDHAGRLERTFHRVNINNGEELLLSANVYNILGQLLKKNLHGKQYVADPLVGQPGTTYADVIDTDEYNGENAFIAKTSVRFGPGFHATSGSTFVARIGLSQQHAENMMFVTTNFAQSIDYEYTIRGWLSTINNVE